MIVERRLIPAGDDRVPGGVISGSGRGHKQKSDESRFSTDEMPVLSDEFEGLDKALRQLFRLSRMSFDSAGRRSPPVDSVSRPG
jgi:hypothetical protein